MPTPQVEQLGESTIFHADRTLPIRTRRYYCTAASRPSPNGTIWREKSGRSVAIALPTHGLSYDGALTLAEYMIGPRQLAQIESASDSIVGNLSVGSAPVDALDAGPITQPGISYTIIVSRSDEIVTPVQNAFILELGLPF